MIKLKGEIDKSTIILGGSNTILSAMDGKNRQKIFKDIEDLNNTINQLEMTFLEHSDQQQYTSFSS